MPYVLAGETSLVNWVVLFSFHLFLNSVWPLYRISFQADSKPSGVNDCRQPKFSLRFTIVDSELLINGHF